jgi:hypothetical protein
VAFVDYHSVEVIYPAPRQSLRRSYLEWHIAICSPVARLEYPMRRQTIFVSFFAGLVDKRDTITDKYCTLATLKRFVGDSQAKVQLPRAGRCHDHLAPMSGPCPVP